jgi:hypothetical protein
MNEAQEKPMSAEEQFLGVKTQVEIPEENTSAAQADAEVEVEIIDDTPPEERKPPKKTELEVQTPEYNDGVSDEELNQYSKGVQKRINQLRAINHADKRKLGEANRMREEAVTIAQRQQRKLVEYESLLKRGQHAILDSSTRKAKVELDQASRAMKQAHEEGDAEKLVESQKAMIASQTELQNLEARTGKAKAALVRKPPFRAPPKPQPKQTVELDQNQIDWMRKNPWFSPMAQQGQTIDPLHKEMTAIGYAIHDNLIHEGINARHDPQRYYAEIDRRIRERFPDYPGFEDVREPRSTPARSRRNTNVVAPSSSRNNGAKTRKLKLTQTQEALAKRLGLTNEQYAVQAYKEAQQ